MAGADEGQAECEEKIWRISFYKRAVAHYSDTVDDLNVARGKVARDGYVNLISRSEVARIEAEQARLELEKHTRQHGC